MKNYRKLYIPASVVRQIHQLQPREYCRRMYFGPNSIMNYWHRHGLERTLNLLPIEPTDRVLDVGCSDGMLLFSLERYSAFSIGIDFSHSMVKWAKRFSPQSSVMVSNGLALPLKDNSFSRVFCLEVLEHVTNPDSVIAEITRVLDHQGKAVITVPIEIGPALLLKRIVSRLLRWNRGDHYNWSQLWQAGVMRSVHSLEHKQDHFGFDFRKIERTLKNHLTLNHRGFLPMPWLGSLFNIRAAFLATKN
ncbi:MAG: class I SAM-dependent methyltransferase [Acidobacteria bacterium]|nr:class I SAM-dependent methyltransferase [Acidobacteriota bacterium]